jgi:hypothetical protein
MRTSSSMRRTAFSVAQIFSGHLPKIPGAAGRTGRRPNYTLQADGMALAARNMHWEELMHLYIDKIGEMTVVECAAESLGATLSG